MPSFNLAEAAEELARLSELKRISSAFKGIDLEAIVYKGTALAYQFYAKPWQRKRCDTDLMIDIGSVEKVKLVLKGLGYKFALNSDQGTISHQISAIYSTDGIDHVLDIHWKFSNRPLFSELFDFQSLKAHADRKTDFGEALFAAGPVDALIIACVHPIMHHYGHFDADWAEDIRIILSQFSEGQLEEWVEKCQRLGIGNLVAETLTNVMEKGEIRVSTALIERLKQSERTNPSFIEFSQKAKSPVTTFAQDFRSLRGFRSRIRFLRAHLLPNREYMEAKYGRAQITRGVMVLLYLRRISGGFKKYLYTFQKVK